MNMTYKEILPGVKLRVIESSRFEMNCCSVQFLAKINDEVASKMTLVPRVLRRGTAKHPDMESLAAALDDLYGAHIEPVSSKFGDIITSGFAGDFVECDESLLHPFIKLLGEIIFDPKCREGVFLDEYVAGERSNLIDEIKSEVNNKLSYAHKRTIENMFENGPYSTNELGTEESVDATEPKSLFKFYKKTLSAAPCEIFFCGRYSFEDVEAEIRKIFKSFPREKVVDVAFGKPSYADDIRVVERLDVMQANLLIGMYTQDEDVYLSKLLASVIGGGTTSKLFTNVREKQSLCYFAGATFDSFKKSLVMYCGIDPKNIEVAEKAVWAEFDKCLSGEITDEEITNAKKGMIDDLLTVEDSPYSMEAFWMRATLLEDERSPLEIASLIKDIDGSRLQDSARKFKKSVVYALSGLEEKADAGKKLLEA